MRRRALLAALVCTLAAACSTAPAVRLADVPPPPGRGEGVALRQLVVATDAKDIGLAAWRAELDHIGTPYDVLLATAEQVDPARLVRPDGVGRYNAVLLTSGSLSVRSRGGALRSALTPASWAALWDYERTFGVRQVAIGVAPATAAEDYCLRSRSEEPIGTVPVDATLTASGRAVFDRLRPDAAIPIVSSFVYRSALTPGCAADPVLGLGPDVVGAVTTSPDGRERLALTMTLPTAGVGRDLLAYGLVRWATRGVFLGEQRNWFAVDVDDWFLPTRLPNGPQAFRLTGQEALSVAGQQDALRARHPLAADFTLTLALNASTLNLDAPVQCDPFGTPDALSSYTLCLVKRFRWLNHTFSHPELTHLSYDEIRAQIADNLAAADEAGIPLPHDILKTPEYSGLGFFSDGAGEPETDHGLGAANPALLRAATDLGVRWLHGNMSFPGHRPACFNCTTAIPQAPALSIVPDWPTSISFEATTPQQAAAAYDATYATAPHGYERMLAAEADLALSHITTGSAYAHTLHQGNLHEYAPGRTLVFDWVDAVLTRYESLFTVPLLNPAWPDLAAYAGDRTEHFAGLSAGDDAVLNSVTGTVTVTPRIGGALFVTGLSGGGDGTDLVTRYGSDSVTRLRLDAGVPAAFTTAVRSSSAAGR